MSGLRREHCRRVRSDTDRGRAFRARATYTVREALAHPHLAERGSFEVIDDGAGPLKVPNPAFKFGHATRAGAQLCAGARAPTTRRCFRACWGIPRIASPRYTRNGSFTATAAALREDMQMGEILAVGITHYPPLAGSDETMSWILKRMLQNPHLPEKFRSARELAGSDARGMEQRRRCQRRATCIANGCCDRCARRARKSTRFAPTSSWCGATISTKISARM